MKRIVVVLALMLVSLNVLAQNVNKASRLLSRGKVADAKEIVDEAIVSEETKNDEKTWYTRGEVYEQIAKSEEAEVKNLAQNPMDIAIEAFHKTIEIAGTESKYGFMADQKIVTYFAKPFNKAIEEYQANNYKKAAELFEEASEVKPGDTAAHLYAATAANMGEMYDMALKHYRELIGSEYTEQNQVYKNIIYILRAVKEDNDKALEVIREAKAAYPDDMDFAKQEINVLIITDRIDEARDQLTAEIAKNPQDADLYSNRAMLYGELGEYEKAKADYKKSLELQPNDYANNYYLGVLYYNQGAEYTQQANAMDLKEYQKKGAAVEEKAKEQFKSAMPYMEKALEVKPEDKNALEALKTIYGRLKMYDKAEAMDQKMQELGYYDEQ
jgi:tetratricopeptide (TPR) repeat protein